MNKKKLNKQDYIFRNQQNQTLQKPPGSINGIDFYIANLENCEVYLFDWLDQVKYKSLYIYKIFKICKIQLIS